MDMDGLMGMILMGSIDLLDYYDMEIWRYYEI
jgi:hypothetical protein